MEIDLLIQNSNELIPMTSKGQPLRGKELQNIQIIENGCVAIKGEKIVAIGLKDDILKDFTITKDTKIIDASGKTVLPGFVDCHTHLVFSGTRESHFVAKIEQERNTKNISMKSGIQYTVSKTREGSKEHLIELAKKRLKRMLLNGITTIESKSGYGLELDTEVKILEVLQELNLLQEVEIEPTFLGAHSIPHGYTAREYTEIVINEMLPEVSKRKLAKFCDVFCENNFFTREQTELILRKAQSYGFKVKVHADQLSNTYGASLAAELNAISADHLDYAYDDGLKAMAQKGVIGVLLPTICFSMDTRYPDAKSMIEMNVPLAISTDFNPGAGYSESMLLVITMACLKLKMLP
ncbi:MAG: imidazolonepropionase, partial [Candidatus Sericytochromatia bacterium]